MSGAALAQRNNNNAPQILIVDIARVSSECTACRAASTQLQTQATALQQRQQTLGQQLQTAQAPLETAINALNGKQPDAALQSRITAFETQRNTAAQEIQRTSQQLQSTEIHVNQQISTRLRTVLEQIRAQRNATVVVAAGTTWAFNPSADVTNDALNLLNQQLPSVSVTPLPQQQQPAPAANPAQPQPQRPQGR
ncbi:OmpH family outer membrane protein [Sphingomonas parva]|nr:OmpH family outer membrane protein [Sphingomonas parva]